ncbi:MAG: phenylalanine--tRNA ligase subunit alpha [Thermoplasmata archaeon]
MMADSEHTGNTGVSGNVDNVSNNVSKDNVSDKEVVERIKSELSAGEIRLLLALSKSSKPGSSSGKPEFVPLNEFVDEELSLQGYFATITEASSAASWLLKKGLVELREDKVIDLELTEEGKESTEHGLVEMRLLQYMQKEGKDTITLSEVISKQILPEEGARIAVGILKKEKVASISKKDGETVIKLENGWKEFLQDNKYAHALRQVKSWKSMMPLEQHRLLKGMEPEINVLIKRNQIRKKESVVTEAKLTWKGKAVADSGLELKETVGQITPQMLATGSWKKCELRPYDIRMFAPSYYGGKKHPLQCIIERIRKVFLYMGFKEIEGDYVQSAFWNMDALFIPQDHPAREMQDTFYMSNPAKIVPQDDEFRVVKAVHETGGNTGSLGWQYSFDEKKASRALLRTHTTVNTIRYLKDHPDPPVKVFCIGKVFRNESIDATHLPEFFQIEGICMEEGSSFNMLIGILKQFYSMMGFEDILIRPSYFPYTEPSLEVAVQWKGRWLELGGAGIFRPEVTHPWGARYPVLAWGQGLERLAMLLLGLKDIRQLYMSDIEWLRNSPLL